MQETKDKAGVLGEHWAEFFDQRMLSKYERIHNLMLEIDYALGLIGRAEMIAGYIFGRKFAFDYQKNVITNVGFNAMAVKRMVGDTTYTGKVNKSLFGNGIVDETHPAANAGSTQLISEVYRNDVLSGSEDGNICYLTTVLTEAEYTGTIKEFGNCIDGTTEANTGALCSYLTGLNWAKDENTAIMVRSKYTFVSMSA